MDQKTYMKWTPELDYAVQRMHRVGMSYNAIALALQVYESVPATREAVSHRLRRLGRVGRPSTGKPFESVDSRRRVAA